MIVRCCVGGCDWNAEGDLTVQLLKAVEVHRQEKHLWVKPGRLHRFDPIPEEPVNSDPVIPSGRKARLREPNRITRR